jgi:ankyrin repeat protein
MPHSEAIERFLAAAAAVRTAEAAAALVLGLPAAGLDYNDGEIVYHAPEGYHNHVLMALVETGQLTPESLSIMLVRKHDWHDYDGVKYLLEHGADPNRRTGWGHTATQHAVLRDNDLAFIELLLDHGAAGSEAAPLAARRGRADILRLFADRGIVCEFTGVERLLAACAFGDGQAVRELAAAEPGLVSALLAEGAKPLAEFAGVGNTAGVRLLLELGIPIDARFTDGDGYWSLAPDSTALHVAAWRARHGTVRLLIDRGAPVDARDAQGRTPLMLAVRACVDSYWMESRAPDSIAALLAAGAATVGIEIPCGYAEADALLARN